jgi:hypothetical protein
LWLALPFGEHRSLYTLERLFEAGARWEKSPAEKVANVRRALLRLSDSSFVEAMKLLAMDSYCSPEILRELARTPSMRARMKKVGFIQSPVDQYQRFERIRPTRSREVLAKCGIEVPKPAPRLPYLVQIGNSRRTGREIRLSRESLFERVWSEPAEELAAEWGLSGRGLAKACHRLKIPVPPRGFWAKAERRQPHRPRLPDLLPGETVEIVIRLPS